VAVIGVSKFTILPNMRKQQNKVSGYRPQSADTPETIDRMMFEGYARMSADAKLRRVRDLNRTCKMLNLQGLRAEHPDATEEELHARWAATFLDEKIVSHLFDGQ